MSLRVKYGKQLLNEQQTAKELGITKKELRGLIDAGEIVALKAGDKYLFTVAAVESFLSGEKSCGLSGQMELSSARENEATYWIEVAEGVEEVYTGSVTHTNGRFISQITIAKLPDGRRQRENKSFKSREEAELHLQTRLAELNGLSSNVVSLPIPTPQVVIAQEVESPYGKKTVSEFTDHYLSLGLGSGTTRTQNGYKHDMAAVLEDIGNNVISQVTEDDMRKLFNKLSEEFAQSVFSKKYITCKMIFTYAYDKDYIKNNPFKCLKKPKSKKINFEEENYAAFTNEQMNRIIQAAKNHQKLYPILTLLKCTGMRPGELRALLWKNFDPIKKTVRIVSAVTREYADTDTIHKKSSFVEKISVPKSTYSYRTLDLSDEAVDALIEWKKILESDKNELVRNSQYIFPSEAGDFRKEPALRSMLDRFVKKYALKDTGIHLYKFRHNFCTNLILANVPISIIMRIMGDNTQDVIMKIYTHVYRDDVRVATQKFFEQENARYNQVLEEKVS